MHTRSLAARLPRHLRDRPAQPGPADPLRDHQRAPRRAWPSAPTPRGSTSKQMMRAERHSAVLASTPTARPGVRRHRVQPVGRADLHQPAQLHRPGRRAGPHGRPAPAEHPLVVAGGHCTYNPEPLADFLDFVVLGDGEEVVGEITEVVADWKAGGAADGRARSAAGARRRSTGVYVPSLYDVDLRRSHRLAVGHPRYPDVPERRREAHDRRSGRVAVPARTSSCRSPRSSTTGSTSRSSGAAPGAVASARPA